MPVKLTRRQAGQLAGLRAPNRPKVKRLPSHLEERFLSLWGSLNGPELAREHRFMPPRRWSADFAHLASRTLVEIEGGVWSHGRHTRGQGYCNDIDKYNAATYDGWRVVRLHEDIITAAEVEKLVGFVKTSAPRRESMPCASPEGSNSNV